MLVSKRRKLDDDSNDPARWDENEFPDIRPRREWRNLELKKRRI